VPPHLVIETLLGIDPDIRKLLPADFATRPFNEPGAPRYEGRVPQWQQAYEILKAKYQKEK